MEIREHVIELRTIFCVLTSWYHAVNYCIESKIMFLGCVIGRRSITNTASSLWPCQKHYLGFYSGI
jgi:hypothetical protein